MASAPNTINLIRSKTSGSSQYETVFESLRRASMIALWVFLFTAAIAGGLYYYYINEQKALEQERGELRLRVDQAKIKEGLLISIKDRTKIVERVLAAQRPWADMLDLVGTAVVPPELSAISVDEQNKVALNITAAAIDDIIKPIDMFIEFAKSGKVRNPQLSSVQFNKNGTVTVSLSFIAPF